MVWEWIKGHGIVMGKLSNIRWSEKLFRTSAH